MKYILLILFSLLTLNVSSQDDKTVTLVVTGQGKTIDEAKQKAIRIAIEQTFETFITSKTEILNNDLIIDELLKLENGIIQNFEIINEVLLPNNQYNIILNVSISLVHLKKFTLSKGITAEFQVGLFAMNIVLQELYEKNEQKVIDELYNLILNNLTHCIDYKIHVSNPFLNENKWSIPINIQYTFNKNYKILIDQIYILTQALSISSSEIQNYKKLNKEVFQLILEIPGNSSIFHLRKKYTHERIKSIPYIFLKYCVLSTQYENGLEKVNLIDVVDKFGSIIINSSLRVYSYSFESIVRSINDLRTHKVQDKGIYTEIKLLEQRLEQSNNLLKKYYNNQLFWSIGLTSNENSKIAIFNTKENLANMSEKQSKIIDKKWFNKDFSEAALSFSQFNSNQFGFGNSPELNSSDAILKISLYNTDNFLNVTFKEQRTIDEVKKISEYKMYLNIIPLLYFKNPQLKSNLISIENIKNSQKPESIGSSVSMGVSLSRGLMGRAIRSTPSFEEDFSENAKIAVDIKIDNRGNVISATIQPRGTTTGNISIKSIALQKARQLKFTEDQNAPNEQLGTIVFNFRISQ